jgi:hypothetical protein
MEIHISSQMMIRRSTSSQQTRRKNMKFKVFLSLVMSILLVPNSSVFAAPAEPLFWNRTQKRVTFTVCGYEPGTRIYTCDEGTYNPEGYGALHCGIGTCTLSVNGQKVRYTEGMGVTLNKYGVLKAFNYTH